MMDWIELTVLTTTEGSDIVSQQLIEAGSAGTVIEDRNDLKISRRPEGRGTFLTTPSRSKWGRTCASRATTLARRTGAPRTRRRTCAAACALSGLNLGIDLGKLEVTCADMDDEDWAEFWKGDYKPFPIGERLVVRPSWTGYEARPGELVLEMDPGMAFGTGTHETTALCAAWLEELVEPGDWVMDLGTGTGILAIAAALLGAGAVLATDIDPVAVRVARENARVNGVEGRVRCMEADVLRGIGESADIVIANIIADVILHIAPAVFDHVSGGGTFLCSGICADRAHQVEAALTQAGFCRVRRREKGEWAAFAAEKPCTAS